MRRLLIPAMALTLSLAFVPMASGAILSFDLCIEFSGASNPGGPAPWATATFDDFGGSGTVQLTLDAHGLIGSEFIGEWNFNFNPAKNVLGLGFAQTNWADVNGVGSVNLGTNAYKADGDGEFDIQFDFAPPGGPSDRLTSGEKVVTTFTMAGLTVADFNFLSENSPTTSWHTAAHVQGIGVDGAQSGWVGDCEAIPEPTTMVLLGLGLLGSGVGLKRRGARR